MQSSRVIPLPRRLAATVAVSILAGQFAVLALVLRAPGAGASLRFLADLATSSATMLALVLLATTRARRMLLVVLAAAVVVLQLLVFRYYHTPLDVQVAASALHAAQDVRPVLLRALPMFLASVAALAVVEYALLSFSHRTLRLLGGARVRGGAPLAGVLGVAALGGAVGLGPRHATPEVRAVHALTALGVRREPPIALAAALPSLHADRAELPSILFVLTESVRASDYQSGGDAPTAPETFALTRGRTDLTQMRAVASYTALSLSALVTGRSQEGPREAILRAPSLFDYARAARDRKGARPFVAYFSSQAETVFEGKQVRAAVDRFASIETLRGRDVEDDADYGELPLDRDIVAYFEKALPALPSPSVVMLHLVGTHAPYFVDPVRAPFQPFDHVVTWSGIPKLRNAYRNAIYEQDRTLSRAVRAFLDHCRGKPWLIVFTSDHGEAFGEHGAIHHGQNLMDEQVHVPGFILAGEGALSAEQQRALTDHAARFVTHLDVLPTMLDALGLWDNSAVATHRAAMPGRSLLRPYEPRSPLPVTNCTGMFPCPLNTWGLYAEDRKLVARVWDAGWACLALGGPEERAVSGADPQCTHLREVSRGTFPLLPNGQPNRW